MTVLSNTQLLAAIPDRLTIDPMPVLQPGDAGAPFDACSINLRLADDLLIIPDTDMKLAKLDIRWDLTRDEGSLKETLEGIGTAVNLAQEGGLDLRPGDFVLGQTVETISLGTPDETPEGPRLCARVEGRSSFARTGLLVHCTAPTIHTFYKGTITLELKNLGPISLKLVPGMEVCQLIIETVDGEPVPKYEPQFDGQGKPSGASG